MEKDALIGIILSDIKEVEILVNSLVGQPRLMDEFINLTLKKVDNVKQELILLQSLSSDMSEVKTKVNEPAKTSSIEIPKPIEKPKATTILDELPIDYKEEIVLSLDDEDVSIDEVLTPDIKTEVLESVITKASDIVANTTPIPSVIEPAKEVATLITEVKPNAVASKPNAVLGETLMTDKNSIIDKLNTASDISNSALMGKPVVDINKAIGINDRFLYQRELFKGDSVLMLSTIGQLNGMSDFEEARSFMKANFQWDYQNDTTIAFVNLVRRKFK